MKRSAAGKSGSPAKAARGPRDPSDDADESEPPAKAAGLSDDTVMAMCSSQRCVNTGCRRWLFQDVLPMEGAWCWDCWVQRNVE